MHSAVVLVLAAIYTYSCNRDLHSCQIWPILTPKETYITVSDAPGGGARACRYLYVFVAKNREDFHRAHPACGAYVHVDSVQQRRNMVCCMFVYIQYIDASHYIHDSIHQHGMLYVCIHTFALMHHTISITVCIYTHHRIHLSITPVPTSMWTLCNNGETWYVVHMYVDASHCIHHYIHQTM